MIDIKKDLEESCANLSWSALCVEERYEILKSIAIQNVADAIVEQTKVLSKALDEIRNRL